MKVSASVLTKCGEGWENYAIESAAGNVLKITGSDDRGVMFGLYRFASECLGVEPFYSWSGPCAVRHAKAALAFGEQRDALDRRYNSGKWEHWYDRDLIYPCCSVTEKLRKAVKGK